MVPHAPVLCSGLSAWLAGEFLQAKTILNSSLDPSKLRNYCWLWARSPDRKLCHQSLPPPLLPRTVCIEG